MRKTISAFMREGGWLRAIPFVLLFVYLIIIYQTVPIFWDDYSFASLSFWGYTQPDVAGTDWTISQLISFCAHAYENFIGRVAFMIFLNALLLRELWLYRIIASVGTTLMFYLLYRFSAVSPKAICAFGTCVCFGLFSRRLFTDTMYYWAGVIAYIIPLIFMFGGIFIFKYLRTNNKQSPIRVAFLLLLSLVTSISQEQICFTYCVTIGLLCLYDLITLHRLKLYQWLVLVISATGAFFLYLAPGNFSRLQIQNYLLEPTYVRQVYKNIQMFFAIFYQKDNLPFLTVFILFQVYLAYLQFYPTHKSGRQDSNMRSKILFASICMWSSVIFLQSLLCEADATVFGWDPTTVTDGYVINMLLYTEVAVFLIFRQLKKINDQYLSAFLLSSLLSVIVTFFYSYYITARMTITLFIALFSIMLRVLSDIDSPNRSIALCVVSTLSCLWLAFFMRGYWKNAPIHRNNDERLTSAAARLRANEPVIFDGLSDGWETYFIPERVYAHDVDQGVVEYYDFPSGVQFNPTPPTLYFESDGEQ